MVTIILQDPKLEERARKLLAEGGDCSEWELLERIVEIAKAESIEVEFIRGDETRTVRYDLEAMRTALRFNLECRPAKKLDDASRLT